MTNIEITHPMRGMYPPMLTPLEDQETLDLVGLERLIEHLLAGGVHGLFILGTTGEGPSISYALRHQLVERVCDQVEGRVPVLVGITDTTFSESLRLAETAYSAGAAMLVSSTPYYHPATQTDLLRYFEHLASKIQLPLLLYNMPCCTKLSIEPETVRRLSDVPNIVGLKDSGGDLDYFRRLRKALADRPDFSLLIGPELLLAEGMALGAHGGVSGGANLCPRLYVDICRAAEAQDTQRLAELQARVERITSTIYKVSNHGGSFIRGLKSALACLGICSDVMAEPFERLNDAERKQIQKHLDEFGFIAEYCESKPATARGQ